MHKAAEKPGVKMKHKGSLIIMAATIGLLLAVGQVRGEEVKEDEDNFKYGDQTQLETFSKQEIKKECGSYEGKYIGYYGHVFRVEKCQRRKVTSQIDVKRITLNHKVIAVNGRTIAMLPMGKELKTIAKARSCQELEKKYVIYAATDIYYVVACRRLKFPDYETYVAHRKKNNNQNVLLDINQEEYLKLKKGRDIPSILPKVFAKLMAKGEDIDIIPISEACEGINGRTVVFYSKIYKVVDCHKREIPNGAEYLKSKDSKFQVIELTSEQWVSLPDGPPIEAVKE